MSDNTQVNSGSGDVVRDVDRGTAKTQVVLLDGGGQAGESLVSQQRPLPTLDSASAAMLSPDTPSYVVLAGDPLGPFKGLGLLELLLDDGSKFALNVKLQPNASVVATGSGASVEVVPAVTAGAYTAGYVIGGVMQFAGLLPPSFNGVLESLTLKFKGSVQTTEFDVALFSAAPAGTFNDNAAPVIAASDSAILLGVFQLTSAFSGLGTHTVYSLDGIAKQIVGLSWSLFAVVISKSVPVNPASVSDMSLRLGTIW